MNVVLLLICMLTGSGELQDCCPDLCIASIQRPKATLQHEHPTEVQVRLESCTSSLAVSS